MMKKIRFIFLQIILYACLLSSCSSLNLNEQNSHSQRSPASNTYTSLKETYAVEYEKAKTLVSDPERLSGVERFQLAYSGYAGQSTEEKIARLILVLESQEALLNKINIENEGVENEILEAKENQKIIYAGIEAVKIKLKTLCGKICKNAEDQREFNALINDLFRTLDLKDAHDGFSGLPFYSLVKEKFFSPDFQEQVIYVGKELDAIIENFSNDPYFNLNTNLYEIALKATGNDKKAAIELLGILNSRDVLVTRYLKYLKTDQKDFINYFGKISVLTKLISHLDRKSKSSLFDTFSFSTDLGTLDERNYYYWSSALLSQKLQEYQYKDSLIKRAIDVFPVGYKSLRYLEAFGFLKPEKWKESFNKRIIESVRISGIGGRFSLIDEAEKQKPTEEKIPQDRFNAFLDSLQGDDFESRKIRDLLKTVNIQNDKNVYILFYDFGVSELGLSHMKLIMDGEVFEIHKNPKQDSYLRVRDLVTGLSDSKSGALPTSILKLEITDKQKSSIKSFLETETLAGEMSYFNFNKLLNSKSYNCAGVIYESLRYAGINLPKQDQRHMLPIFTFKFMKDSLSHAQLFSRKSFLSSLITKPNFSLYSFGLKKRTWKKNSFFSELSFEQTEAEQLLSKTQPFFSNHRRMIGSILKDYSDTGTLPEKYTPAKGEVFQLPSFLIPESEVINLSDDQYFENSLSKVQLNGVNYYRYFLHPTELEYNDELIKKSQEDPIKWMATPSSSARTLFVKDVDGKFPMKSIKLSLNTVMGGSTRDVDESDLLRSRVINNFLHTIHNKNEGVLKESGLRWDFYPETNQLALKGKDNKLLPGEIVRHIPTVVKENIVIPLFALISKRDLKDRWVEELWRYSGYKDKKEFVWKKIVLPLVELHSIMSIDNGLTTEFHQQNFQIAIDPKTKKISGAVIKDLDSYWIDESVRVNKLHMPPTTIKGYSKEALAYHLNFNLAQENQLVSYVGMAREKSIIGIFKYFLSKDDLEEVVNRADNFLISKFNTKYPEFKINEISQLEQAWKLVHEKYSTQPEKILYEKINGSKPTTIVFKIHNAAIKAKAKSSNILEECFYTIKLLLQK